MANFGTRQNNDKDNNQVNVNTKSFQFMNRDGFEPSTMTVGGWNEMFSIRINPALDKSKQTDGRIFDYDKYVATSLTREKATMVLYKIEKVIKPAIEAGEDKTIGIQVGGDSLFVVGTGVKMLGSVRPYVAIHKSLNPDTKKPEMSMFYEFRSDITIDEYDYTTGSYTVSEPVHNEFELFSILLKAYIISGSGFSTHMNRFIDKYYNDRLMTTVNAIAQKTGASSGYGNGSRTGGYSNNRQNIFGSNRASSDNMSDDGNDPVPFGDISDLNSMLND